MGLFDFLLGDKHKGAEAPGPEDARAQAAPSPPARVNGAEHDLGCLVCGKGLVQAGTSRPLPCALCAEPRASTVRCPDGHFVCDVCHAAPAADVIEKVCATTLERDPVALAVRLMQLPALKRHGPEHHFLVPAVLVATFANASGAAGSRPDLVAEARRRADAAPGGARGAAEGAGTFVALATGAGADAPGLESRMTARVLAVVGERGGSRCCKRDSLLSILAAARFSREQLKVELPAHGVGCDWSGRNEGCLGSGCPFNR